MNELLNRKIMIFGMLMSMMMVLTNCNSPQCMKDYYTTNKNRLVEIRTLSQTLGDNYAFQKITIRKRDGELELRFSAEVGGVSMYVNSTNLSLISEHPNTKCSAETLQRFRTMYQDDDLRDILTLFKAIEPKAIRISHGGIFVALGEALESPNENLEGGILMTFEPEASNNRIVEQIETNVFLYDDLIY